MSSVRHVKTARFPSLTKAGSMSRHRSRRAPRSPWWPTSFSASAISRQPTLLAAPCRTAPARDRPRPSARATTSAGRDRSRRVHIHSARRRVGFGAEGSARHARAVSVCSWRSNILLPAPGAPNTTTAFAGARRANWASEIRQVARLDACIGPAALVRVTTLVEQHPHPHEPLVDAIALEARVVQHALAVDPRSRSARRDE